jgi:pimeloyl-ACP methyl ester carboxylesterase
MAEAPVITDPYTDAAERLKTLTKVMTTKAAIAQTPKELVWTLNKAKLYRYTPVLPKEKRHPVPLVLVFALMNRPYILDLRPGHSFVEYMVNKGYDLYLLDWGAPGPEDKNLKFDDYTLDYMPRAIRKLKATFGVEQFSLLGWCIGAILTTIYAALRGDEDGLRNLILLTAPLDFSNKQGLTFARWTDERYFDIDKVLASVRQYAGRDDRLRGEGAQAGRELRRELCEAMGQHRRSAHRRILACDEYLGDRQRASGGRRVPPTDRRSLSQGQADARRTGDSRRARRPEPHPRQSADCNRRGRSHHAVLPV